MTNEEMRRALLDCAAMLEEQARKARRMIQYTGEVRRAIGEIYGATQTPVLGEIQALIHNGDSRIRATSWSYNQAAQHLRSAAERLGN